MPQPPRPNSSLLAIGNDLRGTIEGLQQQCADQAKAVRAMSRALKETQAALAGLLHQADQLVQALSSTDDVLEDVPNLNNRKKALSMAEIDRIAFLRREGYSEQYLAARAGCSPRNISMIIQISQFAEEIRQAIDGNIVSAHFALRLVQKNGEARTEEFLRRVGERLSASSSPPQGSPLISKQRLSHYAALIGSAPLLVD